MNKLAFLKEAIMDFRKTGSFIPSSSFLAKKLVASIRPKPGMCVIELGAGTGPVTKYLLGILPKNSRLIAIEINPSLAKKLAESINDPRLEIISGDASKLQEYLKKRSIEKIDYIVSSIPFGSLPKKTRLTIYNEIKNCLKPSGTYMQFQYFLTNLSEIKKCFIMSDISFEARNFPPAFIYTCRLPLKDYSVACLR